MDAPVRELEEFLILLKFRDKVLANFLEANRYSSIKSQLVLQSTCKWLVHILRGHTSMFVKFLKSVRVVRRLFFHEIFAYFIKNQ